MNKTLFLTLYVCMPLFTLSMTSHKRILEVAKTKNIQKIQKILDTNIDVNIQDDELCYTPLHWAANKGHIRTVELLLLHCATSNAQDIFGHTPLHIAAICGHIQVVELLLAYGAMINVLDRYWSEQWTALDWALHKGHTPIVKLMNNYLQLLEYAQSSQLIQQRQAFTKALELGYCDLAKQLLKKGIVPTKSDLELVKDKYSHEQEQWRKSNYAAIGRMLVQHLRLTTNVGSYSYGPISKSGITQTELSKDIAHIIARFM